MIKLDITKDSLPLGKNLHLTGILDSLKSKESLSYDCADAAVSFTKINSASSYCTTNNTKGFIAVVSQRSFANLVNDVAALRRYDSAFRANTNAGDIRFQFTSGTGIITQSDTLQENQGFILSITDDLVLDTKVEIKIDDILELTMNKDLSKALIQYDNFIHLKNITNY